LHSGPQSHLDFFAVAPQEQPGCEAQEVITVMDNNNLYTVPALVALIGQFTDKATLDNQINQVSVYKVQVINQVTPVLPFIEAKPCRGEDIAIGKSINRL